MTGVGRERERDSAESFYWSGDWTRGPAKTTLMMVSFFAESKIGDMKWEHRVVLMTFLTQTPVCGLYMDKWKNDTPKVCPAAGERRPLNDQVLMEPGVGVMNWE